MNIQIKNTNSKAHNPMVKIIDGDTGNVIVAVVQKPAGHLVVCPRMTINAFSKSVKDAIEAAWYDGKEKNNATVSHQQRDANGKFAKKS